MPTPSSRTAAERSEMQSSVGAAGEIAAEAADAESWVAELIEQGLANATLEDIIRTMNGQNVGIGDGERGEGESEEESGDPHEEGFLYGMARVAINSLTLPHIMGIMCGQVQRHPQHQCVSPCTARCEALDARMTARPDSEALFAFRIASFPPCTQMHNLLSPSVPPLVQIHHLEALHGPLRQHILTRGADGQISQADVEEIARCVSPPNLNATRVPHCLSPPAHLAPPAYLAVPMHLHVFLRYSPPSHFSARLLSFPPLLSPILLLSSPLLLSYFPHLLSFSPILHLSSPPLPPICSPPSPPPSPPPPLTLLPRPPPLCSELATSLP